LRYKEKLQEMKIKYKNDLQKIKDKKICKENEFKMQLAEKTKKNN
jgi:hypothetical protein